MPMGYRFLFYFLIIYFLAREKEEKGKTQREKGETQGFEKESPGREIKISNIFLLLRIHFVDLDSLCQSDECSTLF